MKVEEDNEECECSWNLFAMFLLNSELSLSETFVGVDVLAF